MTIPWAEKVIREEEVQKFYSVIGTGIVNKDANYANGDSEDQSHVFPATRDSPSHLSSSIKLFEHGQEQYLESPLERFLTPDGSSDPRYFARPALECLETHFDKAQGVAERQQMAKNNAKSVARTKAKAQGSQGSLYHLWTASTR